MSTGVENATPLLLAETLMLDVPKGHVIEDPGPVPQPPVQLSAVRPHWFGSVNPSCCGVSDAPNGPLPGTVSRVAAGAAGSVATIAATALASPAPKMLLGAGEPRGCAPLTIRLRIF